MKAVLGNHPRPSQVWQTFLLELCFPQLRQVLQMDNQKYITTRKSFDAKVFRLIVYGTLKKSDIPQFGLTGMVKLLMRDALMVKM